MILNKKIIIKIQPPEAIYIIFFEFKNKKVETLDFLDF